MDERCCGECNFFQPGPRHDLDARVMKLLYGWGMCGVTGRIVHESTLCDDCEDYSEDEEGE